MPLNNKYQWSKIYSLNTFTPDPQPTTNLQCPNTTLLYLGDQHQYITHRKFRHLVVSKDAFTPENPLGFKVPQNLAELQKLDVAIGPLYDLVRKQQQEGQVETKVVRESSLLQVMSCVVGRDLSPKW